MSTVPRTASELYNPFFQVISTLKFTPKEDKKASAAVKELKAKFKELNAKTVWSEYVTAYSKWYPVYESLNKTVDTINDSKKDTDEKYKKELEDLFDEMDQARGRVQKAVDKRNETSEKYIAECTALAKESYKESMLKNQLLAIIDYETNMVKVKELKEKSIQEAFTSRTVDPFVEALLDEPTHI